MTASLHSDRGCLRKSEEDLIKRTCSFGLTKTGIKSDSLSDLLNGSDSDRGEFCFVNSLVLFGGSVSAPALTELSALDKFLSESKTDSGSDSIRRPKIVINKPSDDEDNECDNGDDFDPDEYYKRQLVLSEWEELCRDLRVTEL